MDSNERLYYLLNQYVAGSLSADEHDELFALISTNQYDDLLAQHILHDLEEGNSMRSADLPPHIAQEIIRNIYGAERNTIDILPVKKHPSISWRWMAAACIVFVAVSVSVFLMFNKKSADHSFASLIPDHTLTKTNQTSLPQPVLLSDGTIVTLSPHSSIHYAKKFSGDNREVFLEGEAFFQVTKNPQRPFLVYYNDIVTKVLGTSFTVNTNSNTGNIEVSVKTGRVQVYENEYLSEDKRSDVAVIVTPNQKAIYKKEHHLFETTLVDKPETITTENQQKTPAANQPLLFVFEQEKLQSVFKSIEDSYGIEIVVENEAINDCVFTGDVSAIDLYTKLKIICLTVNASYEINGTKILIKGKGCS